jgi:hypothetical protein
MTENKDDLISRSRLKETINAFYDAHFVGCVSNELITYAKGVDIFIDNAPTVEPETSRLALIEDIRKKQMDADKAFLEGYERGKNERPQGEWIPLFAHNIYKCSECERTIGLTTDETLSDYPFCHCGADMRGDKE